MKKLTVSVLVVALSSSFVLVNAQSKSPDSVRTKNIEEVVVNALGVRVKKEQLASSYSKVAGTAVSTSGESSALQGLSGKASGVQIVTNSGAPGAGAYIQIRGQNSITGSTQPLFVVDGVPVSSEETVSGAATTNIDGVNEQNRIGDINPNDIDDIQILKGGSAAALWGFRARNGVVLITTKRGKNRGKINVTFKSSYSIDQVNHIPDMQSVFGQGLNGKYANNSSSSWGDYIPNRTGASDVYNTAGAKFVTPQGNVIYPIINKNSRQTYNQSNWDAVFGNGTTMDNYLSLSGASDKGDFLLSVGRLDQDGVMRNSNYKRTTLNFSSDINISDKTKLSTTFAFTNSTSNRIQQGSNLSGLMLGLLRNAPDFDIRNYIGTLYDADGVATPNAQLSYRNNGLGTATAPYNNPLWTLYKQKNPDNVNSYRAGADLSHKFNPWFELHGKFGLNAYNDTRFYMFPIHSQANAGLGSATYDNINYQQWNFDAFAVGNGNLTEKLNLFYTAGINFSSVDRIESTEGYVNFLTDTDKFDISNSTNANRSMTLSRTNTKLAGIYFTATFDYDKFLFLTLGGRNETSSAFAPAYKFVFSPSAELGIETARFMNSDWYNSGKIRLTYGRTAGLPAAYNGYTYYVGAGLVESYGPAYDAAAYNGSFVRSATIGNDHLKPEVKTEYEIGYDFSLFHRGKFGFTYYNNNIKDLLIYNTVNPSSGFQQTYGNFASMKNHGFEVDANIDVIKSKDFVWNLFGNWSTNKNMVTSLNGTDNIFLAGFSGTSSNAVVGYAMGELYGGKYLRDSGGKLVLDANAFPQLGANGPIGDPNPKWKAGLGTSITYKKFKLSTLFDAQIGGKVWDGTSAILDNFGKTPGTAVLTTLSAADAANLKNSNGVAVPNIAGVIKNSDGTYTIRGSVYDFGGGRVILDQSWYQGLGGGFGPISETFVKDGSWIKWRQLSLDYTLDGSLIKNTLGIRSVNIGASARNLWMWTKDKTLSNDPESNVTGGTNGRGMLYFNNPNTKSYIFTLQINF